MSIKLIISAFMLLWTFSSTGQSLQKDSLMDAPFNSVSLVPWSCYAGESGISWDSYPLVIINGKKFKNCLIQNLYFNLDTSNISKILVLISKSDSISRYGKSGRNGVIIIITKRQFEWLSVKQIIKLYSKHTSCSPNKTLVKVDSAVFDINEEVYFQKDMIKSVSINNSEKQYSFNRQFNCVLTIALTKKSGT